MGNMLALSVIAPQCQLSQRESLSQFAKGSPKGRAFGKLGKQVLFIYSGSDRNARGSPFGGAAADRRLRG